MKTGKYRYFSFTDQEWVNVTAEQDGNKVYMEKENGAYYGLILLPVWNEKKSRGFIKEGWED
jgi:hypothetical protein